MECDVCMQHFDSEERRPKVLPCGHTYCISCLRQLPAKQCPVDKKVFQLDNLSDNYKLLTPVRFWCISCEKEATGHCVDRHDIRSVTAQRTKASESLLSELHEGEEALAALAGVLDEEAVNRQAQDCSDLLKQERVRLASARNRLLDAVGAEASVWEQATQAAVAVQSVNELSQSAAQLTNDVFDPSTSWTVLGAVGGVAAWTGEMRPAENAAARLLLCGLACSGGLRASAQQPDKQPNPVQQPVKQPNPVQQPDKQPNQQQEQKQARRRRLSIIVQRTRGRGSADGYLHQPRPKFLHCLR
ncbi:uncharacterized protein LOC117654237 isoform X2 [Thrips palmi]|uniref:Uncharacterized protein LOC117654237 isoform X2 n=1 Tax=Thrips palmi TaxID=161013 RepID=A0A6P9AG42_THRPL|nr:uncharacterized protein LOC117654237 isoform X2 [Thrips palmi]